MGTTSYLITYLPSKICNSSDSSDSIDTSDNSYSGNSSNCDDSSDTKKILLLHNFLSNKKYIFLPKEICEIFVKKTFLNLKWWQ